MMYTNIDGLLSSRLELQDYVMKEKPDIICLTETKLNEKITVNLDNKYNTWRKDRQGKGGGGVMIMIKKEIKVDKVWYGGSKAEVISIQIKDEGNEVVIMVTYVPPKTNSWTGRDYEDMIKDTLKSIEDVLTEKRKVLLLGDFNCKEVDWENFESGVGEKDWGERFLTLMMENMMEQRVKENTRYRGDDEPARLDLVLTREVNLCGDIQYKCPLGKSDHVVMEMQIEVKQGKRDEAYRRDRLNYRKMDSESLKKFFEKLNWEEMLQASGVQKKYDIFMNYYREGVTKFVPKYKPKEEGRKDWFNATCAKAKEKRDTAWKRWKRNRSMINKESYKMARNEYVRVRKEEERKFEKDIVNKCKEHPKMFYRFVNGKLKKEESIERLKGEHGIVDDLKIMAELLNNRFQQVFTKETLFEKPTNVEGRVYMDEIKITKSEIYKILEDLDGDKAMGPDEVSARLLKVCREELIEPIYDIIRCSLETGEVPVEWKRAEVIPIYKSGRREEPLNYRPVSLTSVVCKICERVIKKRWINFLEDHKLLSEQQFGFRKGRSCVTNLLSFYSRVVDKIQEREGWMDCIYLDLKKAFDKVPHTRLLWKLEYCGGLKGKMLKWIESYLRGREMRTVIKDVKSDWLAVESGVPQGSVLAPVLFLVYVNDLPEGVTSYMNLFADDAKLCRCIKSEEDCEILQSDLDVIWRWSKKWEMEFNLNKSHVVEMGKSGMRPRGMYKMGEGTELERVDKEKDLGVIIQDNGQFEAHIDKMFGETYNLIRNIGLAFHYMDKDMMKKLINTMIRPRLEYAGVVWSPYKKKHIKKLERLQRMATRMVPELAEMTYEERLKELNLLTLEQRRERGDLIQIYKLLSGLDEVDNEKLMLKEDNTNRTTRSHSKKLTKGSCLKDVKKYSFPQRCVEVWNSLSEEVVTARSVHSFKGKLDLYRYGDGATRV